MLGITSLTLAWVNQNSGSGHLCNPSTRLRFTEFKEIRKEWKARKKEEETQRKQEDDRHRASLPEGQHPEGHPAYQQPGRPQLPPIGYQPGSQVPGKSLTPGSFPMSQISVHFR